MKKRVREYSYARSPAKPNDTSVNHLGEVMAIQWVKDRGGYTVSIHPSREYWVVSDRQGQVIAIVFDE